MLVIEGNVHVGGAVVSADGPNRAAVFTRCVVTRHVATPADSSPNRCWPLWVGPPRCTTGPAGSGTRLVVSRARSSGYVLGMGDSDTRGRDGQREYETHGQLSDPLHQLAELELYLRRCARSGW